MRKLNQSKQVAFENVPVLSVDCTGQKAIGHSRLYSFAFVHAIGGKINRNISQNFHCVINKPQCLLCLFCWSFRRVSY